MRKVTELTVRSPMDAAHVPGVSAAGALGPVAAALGRANVQIMALTAGASSAGRIMNIRILVSDPARASEALKAEQINVAQNEALSLDLSSRPNALADLTGKLGRAGVSIKAVYAAASGDSGLAVVSVSDIQKAQAALK